MSFEIGDFGRFQNNFIDILKRKYLGIIHKITLDCRRYGNKKQYEMVFRIRQRDTQTRFTVRFKENTDEDDDVNKSITFRQVQLGDRVHTLLPHYDPLSQDEMCAKWLEDVLFKRGYWYDKAEITFPPRELSIPEGGNNIINCLRVYVPFHETDPSNLNWWFSRLGSLVKHITIKSDHPAIHLRSSDYLKSVRSVSIEGNTDIDIEFIKDYRGKCIVYEGGAREFSIDEFKDLILHCNEISTTKAICLYQGTAEKGKIIRDWLDEEFPDHMVGVDYFIRRKLDNDRRYLYFEMTNGRCLVGSFDRKKHTKISPSKWPKKIANCRF